MTARILLVEDERGIQLALGGLLKKEGYEVEVASNAAQAIDLLKSSVFDLVLTDLALGSGKTGMDVLEASRKQRAETPVLLITAHGNEKIAVEAMKKGAEDYLPKPFDNDEMRLTVRRALERTRLAREHRLLLEQVQREYGFGSIIGSGPGMKRVFEVIKKAAETDLTVLVRGESGTGKELVAQALHFQSLRRDRPFIAVNCAAISKELVESELFGHEKGAFTGAEARRVGRFEAAEGGTIFLDEIGDMPLETQAKVLRVLQDRTLLRVGGNTEVSVDVRVVAATHRDLEAQVEEGTFREDLYYRLKVIEARLPALRERIEDVAALSERFLSQVAERLQRPKKSVSTEALKLLMGHPWPGNVRELRHTVEQAAVMSAGDEIQPNELSLGQRRARGFVATPTPGVSFSEAKKQAVETFERAYLEAALKQNAGNISRTAEAVGMVRQSLQQKLKELEMDAEVYKP